MHTPHVGRWHRSRGALVIDLDSYADPLGDGYDDELTFKQRAALGAALKAARDQLREPLKSMKSLKGWVGSGPDDAPFAAAFTATRNKAKVLATAYTKAANAYVLPTKPSAKDALKELQDFLEDMDALKDPATMGNDPKVFLDAFTAARAQGKLAASLYISVGGP